MIKTVEFDKSNKFRMIIIDYLQWYAIITIQ